VIGRAIALPCGRVTLMPDQSCIRVALLIKTSYGALVVGSSSTLVGAMFESPLPHATHLFVPFSIGFMYIG
jgi:hypothetical protein